MYIKVHANFGPKCVNHKDAQHLAECLDYSLLNMQQVVLDFEDVAELSDNFLKSAFGGIPELYTYITFRNYIKIKNIKKKDSKRITKLVKNNM